MYRRGDYVRRILEWVRLILNIAICVIGLAYLFNRLLPRDEASEDSPNTAADTAVVAADTIAYIAPAPGSEGVLEPRRYTLAASCFRRSVPEVGPIGVKLAANICVTRDSLTAAFGTGAGGEPRCCGDSVTVELPMIQRHYADSTYEAWVSGPVNPRLDSVRVFAPVTVITRREWKPPRRWHIGITAGYGLTSYGLKPYIGIGISYSLFTWK